MNFKSGMEYYYNNINITLAQNNFLKLLSAQSYPILLFSSPVTLESFCQLNYTASKWNQSYHCKIRVELQNRPILNRNWWSRRKPNTLPVTNTHTADGVRGSGGRAVIGSGGGGICWDRLAGLSWVPRRRTLAAATGRVVDDCDGDALLHSTHYTLSSTCLIHQLVVWTLNTHSTLLPYWTIPVTQAAVTTMHCCQ